MLLLIVFLTSMAASQFISRYFLVPIPSVVRNNEQQRIVILLNQLRFSSLHCSARVCYMALWIMK